MKWFWAAFALLLVNSAYIFSVHSATVFYMGNVLLHLGLGVLLALAALFSLRQRPLFSVFVAASLAGSYLAIAGNTRSHEAVLWLHVFLGIASVLAIVPYLTERRRWVAFASLLAVASLTPHLYNRLRPDPSLRIVNPLTAPVSMKGEGGGEKSPFYPSSIQTVSGGKIPSDFFMDSKGCGECHQDIYKQWNSSAHHFASFNNQFYRKSIEYMQDVAGDTQPSKWCAGCHDHAVLLNGKWDKPIKEQIDTPEAQNGLGCMSCHSIVSVQSSMGNGGFTMEYPALAPVGQ